MGRYIGAGVQYGIFEKQVLTPDGVENTFSLLYRAASANALLVSIDGILSEPGIDFVLDNGGQTIVFTSVPLITSRIYIIYLGKELSTPAAIGRSPIHISATGNGIIDTFTLAAPGPIVQNALLVFADGVLLHPNIDWTLAVSGYDVEFTVPPANLSKIDFYINGIERSDLASIPDHSITSQKLELGIELGTSINPTGTCFLGDTTVTGDLIVQGTTTTVNSEELSIADNIITLNSDFLSGTPTENAGINIKRGSENDAELLWDENNNEWVAGTAGNLDKIITQPDLDNHTTNFSNPHGVTKTQVGLGNVTNDAQLKRAAGDIDSFNYKGGVSTTLSDEDDLVLLEDSTNSFSKVKIKTTNILPETVSGNHTFSGNIDISGDLQVSGNFVRIDPGTYTNSEQREVNISFNTLNNTQTTAKALTIPDQTLAYFKLSLVGRFESNSINSNICTFINGAVRRNGGGSATLVGVPHLITVEENASSYDISIDVSGNDLLIRVIGDSGGSVVWVGKLEYQFASLPV